MRVKYIHSPDHYNKIIMYGYKKRLFIFCMSFEANSKKIFEFYWQQNTKYSLDLYIQAAKFVNWNILNSEVKYNELIYMLNLLFDKYRENRLNLIHSHFIHAYLKSNKVKKINVLKKLLHI